MTICRRNDGSDLVQCQATIDMNLVIAQYHYQSECSEIWKQGHLLQMESSANFNGEQYRVKNGAFEAALPGGSRESKSK